MSAPTNPSGPNAQSNTTPDQSRWSRLKNKSSSDTLPDFDTPVYDYGADHTEIPEHIKNDRNHVYAHGVARMVPLSIGEAYRLVDGDPDSVDEDFRDKDTQRSAIAEAALNGTALAELEEARVKYAEVSVKTREGKLLSSDKKQQEKFLNAQAEYRTAFDSYIKELEATNTVFADPSNNPDADSVNNSLISIINAREEGRIMGEEAHMYVDRHLTHKKHKAVFQRSVEFYNRRGKFGKLALGAGAIVLAGASFGMIGGGAAVGLIASKFGRNYFKQEAARRNGNNGADLADDDGQVINGPNTRSGGTFSTALASSRERYIFENSTLKSSGVARFATVRDLLVDGNDRDAFVAAANSFDTNEINKRYEQSAADERRAEKKAKRKSVAKALAFTALAGGVGYIAEHTALGWRGLLRGDREFNLKNPFSRPYWSNDQPYGLGHDSGSSVDTDSGNGVDPEVSNPQPDRPESGSPDANSNERIEDLNNQVEDLNNQIDELNEQNAGLESQVTDLQERLDAAQEAADNGIENAPFETPSANELFGYLAGQDLDITIEPGGNIWDALEAQVDAEYSYTSFEYKQDLVGNMVARLQEQLPDRDLSLVYPGETFTLNLH